MKTIDIPDDLYTELLEKALDLNYRNLADVIRFFLTEIKNKEAPEGMGAHKNHFDLVTKGGTIPHGTKLQRIYKGRRFEGVIDNGAIILDGKKFRSPSEAAIYVARLQGTPNPSFNGWMFWDYFDVQTGKWGNLSRLRRGLTPERPIFVKHSAREESKKTSFLICECKSKDVYARGKQDGKSFLVLKDSTASPEETPSQPVSNKTKREQLIREGVLRRNGHHLIFTRDYRFNSPSAAAGVVLGRSAYGKLEWQPEQ